jgi:hypothetical protein
MNEDQNVRIKQNGDIQYYLLIQPGKTDTY